MKCPNCSKEISDTAKFCKYCGSKIEAATQVTAPIQMTNEAPVCANCGKPLTAKSKFCPACGTPVNVNATQEDTVLLNTDAAPQEVNVDVQKTEQLPVQETVNLTPMEPAQIKEKKKGNGLLMALVGIAVALLVVAGIVAVIFLTPLKHKIPFINKLPFVTQEENDDQDEEDATEGTEETAGETEEAKQELPKDQLKELKNSIKEGKKAFKNEDFTAETGCLTILDGAIDKCVEYSAEFGVSDDLAECAKNALKEYVEVKIWQIDLLKDQDVRPELYEQMVADIDDGIAASEKLKTAGFDVEADELEEMREKIKESYTKRYVEAFDELKKGETWSRTESWEMMSNAESIGLVDYGDMDSDITQRYAYALARVTIKTVENGLADKSMKKDEAVEKLREVLKDTDYNLFLMHEMISYCEKAGEKDMAKTLETCCNDIVEHIAETQGITVGDDVPFDRFWIFDEDDDEGLSKENHEWIRSYMADKDI